MTAEEIKETIDKAVRESIKQALPKEWLTKAEVIAEFGISETTLWRLINEKRNPLPYTTFGDKKQLFNRKDINAYLERNKRNILLL
jgi:predicted DNA-binding transcriptional regulator AlpA